MKGKVPTGFNSSLGCYANPLGQERFSLLVLSGDDQRLSYISQKVFRSDPKDRKPQPQMAQCILVL